MSSHGAIRARSGSASLDDMPAAAATAAERQAGRRPGGTQLVAEVGEQAPAAAGATGRVRLGHRHILTERPHQPINRTATIGP